MHLRIGFLAQKWAIWEAMTMACEFGKWCVPSYQFLQNGELQHTGNRNNGCKSFSSYFEEAIEGRANIPGQGLSGRVFRGDSLQWGLTALLRVADSKAMSKPVHLITTDERVKEYSELVVVV